VELGKVERKNCPVYLLCDSFYMDKIYAPKTYKGEMNYDFYGMNYDATSISIYPDSFSCHTHFDSRWNNFVRYFHGQFFADSGWFEYIKEFRQSVCGEIKEMGGQLALYGDDQGDSYYIEYDSMKESFASIKQKLIKDFGRACLNVSEFQRNYTSGKFEEIEYKAFFDDFADL
jgi:hypothetical protein